MGLRTPSKIRASKQYGKYYVRYVTHGGAIRYSNIEKNLNAKGILAPQGYNNVLYLGIVNADVVILFPHYPNGSESMLFAKLPSDIASQIKSDTEELIKKIRFTEGLYLTLFIYRFN